jgi:hypothetical protein
MFQGLHINNIPIEVYKAGVKIDTKDSMAKVKRTYGLNCKNLHKLIGKEIDSNRGKIILKYAKVNQ